MVNGTLSFPGRKDDQIHPWKYCTQLGPFTISEFVEGVIDTSILDTVHEQIADFIQLL